MRDAPVWASCLLLLTLTFVFSPPTGDQVEISFYSLNHGEIVSKVSVKDRCLLLELVWSTRAYSTVTSRGFSMFSCSFLLRHRHLSGDHVEISFYSLIMGKMLVKCIMASSLGSTWLKLKGTVCIASSCKHPSSLLYGSIFWRQIFRNEW